MPVGRSPSPCSDAFPNGRRPTGVYEVPTGGFSHRDRLYVFYNQEQMMLTAQIAKAGPTPEAVVKATYGWWWSADVLQAGASVHLAHPLG